MHDLHDSGLRQQQDASLFPGSVRVMGWSSMHTSRAARLRGWDGAHYSPCVAPSTGAAAASQLCTILQVINKAVL